MPFSTLLFDLDGTLTDPAEGITHSIQYALKKQHIIVSDLTTLYPFIGPPLVESFQRYYHFSHEQALQALTDYREYFSEKGIYENRLYPGIPEMLARLKNAGKTLLVASSKPEPFVRRILAYFHLESYFTVIAGSTMAETRQKKEEVIAYALEKCGIFSPVGAAMVGDRGTDMSGAKKLGITAIGVLFGYGSREELLQGGADFLAADTNELETIFMQEKGEIPCLPFN